MSGQRKIILIVGVFLLTVLGAWTFLASNFERNVWVQNIGSKLKRETTSQRVVSFISPHHLVAQKLIENIFRKVAEADKNAQVKRIILLSPNHENVGHGWGIIADKNWDTNNGMIEADAPAIKSILKDTTTFVLDNAAFEKEHGILNLLPFVEQYFPTAKVVPIMLRDGLSVEKAKSIANDLANNFGTGTIVVLSADFSHYIGETASQMHDQKSIAAIESFDYGALQSLDVDCRGGLVIAEKFSEILGAQKFNLVENSNSSKIYGQNFGNGNTSYVTGYFSLGEKNSSSSSTELLFFGDLMLDRDIRSLLERNGATWPTEKIQRLFWSQDFNIANLEGPITSNPSISLGSQEGERRNFFFTLDPGMAKNFLKGNSISIVDLGNNHIGNFGEAGISETKKYLDQMGVAYFGNPLGDKQYLAVEKNGVRIAFVSYNQFGGPDSAETINNIQSAKKEGYAAIVMAHWGTEYQLAQNEKQIFLAHSFIDAGADLVIGSHPHVIQPLEIYKGKAVFYSLGNFIFDQYFSEDVKTRLAVGISIRKNETNLYLIPLYLEKNGQLSIMEGEKRQKVLSGLSAGSQVDNSVKGEIMEGRFDLKN